VNIRNGVEEKNAIVEGFEVFIEDHGILTAYLYLDYGEGSHQGFGGYALQSPAHPGALNAAGIFIRRVLEICEVDRVSECAGKTVRARASFSGVEAIGHVVKDDWFCPKEEFARLRERSGVDT